MPYARPIEGNWPNPADSPLERAQAIAREYRGELLKLDRELCLRMDERARYVGQGWVAPRASRHHPEDLLTARHAADYCNVRPTTLQQWKGRGLKVTSTADGSRYRVRDLDDYRAGRRVQRRTRGKVPPE